MANDILQALELAFAAVRDEDMSLAARLQHIANRVRELSPPFAEAVDVFVSRLLAADAGHSAPQVGELMPDFLLPDDEGHLVNLHRLLETAPVAVVFHRGHWCPYCRMNLIALAEVQDAVKPVQIVAISAQTQAYTRAIKAESGARFPILTDLGGGYTLSLNLAIWVDETMASIIAASGVDVPSYQGETGWVLPIPSVFVVGQDGLIKARHVDADYRRRFEPADLIQAAQGLRSLPVATA